MKKTMILFATCLTLLFLSCDKEKPIGIWGDIIKLSSKKVKFDKSGGINRITTKGDSWWILPYVYINGEIVYFHDDNSEIILEYGKFKGWDNPNVIYDEGADMEIIKIESSWFIITKDTYKSITIEMRPNETGLPRTLKIELEAGNYFDRFTVEQSN